MGVVENKFDISKTVAAAAAAESHNVVNKKPGETKWYPLVPDTHLKAGACSTHQFYML